MGTGDEIDQAAEGRRRDSARIEAEIERLEKAFAPRRRRLGIATKVGCALLCLSCAGALAGAIAPAPTPVFVAAMMCGVVGIAVMFGSMLRNARLDNDAMHLEVELFEARLDEALEEALETTSRAEDCAKGGGANDE